MAQRTVTVEQYTFVFKSVEVDEDKVLICEPDCGWYSMEDGSSVPMSGQDLADELVTCRELIAAQLWEQINAEND